MRKKSFTLIETIVAISIFILGVLSVLSYIQFSLKAVIRQQESIIIQALAQEGIEAIKNFRDNNFLNERNYDVGLNDGQYNLDFDGISFYKLLNYSAVPLRINTNSSAIEYYGHNLSGIATKFYRKISLNKYTDLDDVEYIRVLSVVSNNPNFSSAYVLEDRLYNWFGQ